MNRERFEELVGEALDSLPEEFLHGMENIEVVVEDWPSPEDLESAGIEDGDRYTLFGLYHGVPLTERGVYYSGVQPDLITIYQRPIERAVGPDPARLREQIRVTVLHEVAHHFGIDDERLDELGWA